MRRRLRDIENSYGIRPLIQRCIFAFPRLLHAHITFIGSHRDANHRRSQPNSGAVSGSCSCKSLVFSYMMDIQIIETLLAGVSSMHKVVLKPRPPLVDGFVGRADILEAMRHNHLEDLSSHRNMPRLTVLTGLGGSGKTQIALKFVSEFEER
jgi:hypothetical protein